MRHTVPFDTHAYVKQLTSVGVPEPQAEVHARALADLVDEHPATKTDLDALRIGTQHDIDALRIAAKRDLDEMRLLNERSLIEVELRLKAHLEGELRKQMLWFFTTQSALLAIAVAVIVAVVRLH
jgi:hypothetical protein